MSGNEAGGVSVRVLTSISDEWWNSREQDYSIAARPVRLHDMKLSRDQDGIRTRLVHEKLTCIRGALGSPS